MDEIAKRLEYAALEEGVAAMEYMLPWKFPEDGQKNRRFLRTLWKMEKRVDKKN